MTTTRFYRGAAGPQKPAALPEPLSLRIGDAARALGISERKLHDLTKRGAVPHVRLDGLVLYPVGPIRDWLTAAATGPVIASATADAAEGGDA